ncbi:MAG TPA: aspartate aminotransferase family protein [Clostridiales bacterium]|jgi:acetylornithine/N-succinyldiaminopimelate aminotransferase|nr:aspartate aminotransferase family protein [Clostridiales bacterium]
MKQYIDEAEKVLMHTYNRYKIVLDHGKGMYLYDIEGKKYLDFVAGIAVFALGYNYEQYNEALKKQLDTLIHTSNIFYSIPPLEAAKKLIKASGMDRVFFTNSGTEAVEGAIKLARKYYYNKTGKAGGEIISMEHSFHGRSMGALSITGTKKYREAFEPLIGGVRFAEFNDLSSVKANINDNTCAVIMEPIQGEGGIYPATEEFIKGVRKLCDDNDILLIFDEIQCGMGRTGSMFAYQSYGVKPDIITCAKGLGCGIPVGAFAATEEVAMAFQPGDHGTTYGGNPFATKAVSTVFDIFESTNILENVNVMGQYLSLKLDELKNKYSIITDHRGKGLLQGLEFSIPVKDIIAHAMDEGLLLISAGEHVIRFIPPLIVEKKHVDDMTEIFTKCLNKVV